jgi:NAD(P) transhydrogenase subunit alpha
MKVAVPKETFPHERRVAVVPANLAILKKQGIDIIIQAGAGQLAGFPDAHYVERGATVAAARDALFECEIVVQVRAAGANLKTGGEDLQRLRNGQVLIASCDPLGEPDTICEVAETGASLFALELIPRITRAQSMDVLSSMATIAGYRAVLLGAVEVAKMFPMLMTAAGTIQPARVFVIGAGVAGLQAIATARRLGAVVHAYDVRAACREQVESLGGKFVELPLEATESEPEDKDGYAQAMGDEFYQKQRQLMADIVKESDLVITTAAIPGKQSPLLITADAVVGMAPGSVIVDLAAERGGNCELSQADQRVVANLVTILGPTNLPAEIPYHASQMFSNNVTQFLLNFVKEGAIQWNMDDQIIRETLVARGGEVVSGRIREMLGLPTLEQPEADDDAPPASASDDAASDSLAAETVLADVEAEEPAGIVDTGDGPAPQPPPADSEAQESAPAEASDDTKSPGTAANDGPGETAEEEEKP